MVSSGSLLPPTPYWPSRRLSRSTSSKEGYRDARKGIKRTVASYKRV
ncbi:unnamed protein product [Timema podura]|uniref:Uncharacterized protein n=1 Tax=Timema podura TaxID=61482 RepID=A0ABN7PI46_TIMPD|nr:unnamed protein product [Timema podura]